MDRCPGRGGAGGGGSGTSTGGCVQGAQLLGLAEKFLNVRDLIGARKFAERAMEVDPLIENADRVLAVADVLLAAQRRRINNHVDWYAVLQLEVPASSCTGRDLSDVRFQYRRLALLLRSGASHPFRSPYDEAFKLVSDAWAVLSDPSKKALYDKELAIAATAHLTPSGSGVVGNHAGIRVSCEADGDGDGDGSFWTACTNCFYVHQYKRGYEGRSLLCSNCRKPFLAAEIAAPPPIVPGSDMYYCAWGLFPLGFPGGPDFEWPGKGAFGVDAASDAAGKRWSQEFFQGFPSWWGAQGAAATGGWPNAEDGKLESHAGFGSSGKRRMEGDMDVSSSQSFPADSTGKAHGVTGNEEGPPKEMRRKVMAIRRKRQVGGAVGCGVAASREAEVAADDSANMSDADMGEGLPAAKSDGGDKAQDVGCSRTVEISEDDQDLNFSVGMDATDNILGGLSTLPFLKDGEVVVVD